MPARGTTRARRVMLSINDVAHECNVDPRTVRRWIAAGHLKAARLGHNTVRIDPADVDAMYRPTGTAS